MPSVDEAAALQPRTSDTVPAKEAKLREMMEKLDDLTAICKTGADDEAWSFIEEAQGKIAKIIRRMLGEAQLDEQIFTPAMKAQRIKALQDCVTGNVTPEDRHIAWTAMYESQGWKYGEKLDSERKLHPNLLPWDQLPEAVKAKADIFAVFAELGQKLTRD